MPPSTLLRSNLDIPDETTSAEAAGSGRSSRPVPTDHPGDIGTVRLVADIRPERTIPGSALPSRRTS
ncbi:MAG: hypothetical protein IPH38_15045 [Candidatus Microthrix sp.]|nr:hypothetical protein [Candidatus Microthrix sp.]